ncbi:DUF3040 domain-containing protein [Streptomyces griseoluteus]|uniref:DUF3040 domain-containing protein n=1 Tax=Streptomyces griseoluteus TaxID=29306 RepID=UPI0037F97B15
MGAPSLTPQELRILAEMEQGLNDAALARRLSTMGVPSRPATRARRPRRRTLVRWVTLGAAVTLTLIGVEVVLRQSRSGGRTPRPTDPAQV